MDALTERVMHERIRTLSAKLEIALRQRDSYRASYHTLVRLPHQERQEIVADDDYELESAAQTKKDR